MLTVGEQHIVKRYDEELDKLHDAIARMGGLAEAQLAAAITALADRDSAAATRIMADDAKVDALDQVIGEQVVRILALRSPVADDLRRVITGIKVGSALERIGDYACNVAKRALVLNELPAVAPVRAVSRMGWLVVEMLKETMDAYLGADAESALHVRSRDQEVDDLYSSLFRELLTYMMEDPRNITPCTHLLFIAKNIERIGDHVTNVAEMTYYLARGEQLTTARPKRDTTTLPLS